MTIFGILFFRLKKLYRKVVLKIFPREIKIQLLWSTWCDVCDLVGDFKNGTRGEYVDGKGNISDPSTGIIGFYYNNNGENFLLQEGDWIIKDKLGKFSYMRESQMRRSIMIEKINI